MSCDLQEISNATPEIMKFSLFGFSSKLESEMTKKIYESCP